MYDSCLVFISIYFWAVFVSFCCRWFARSLARSLELTPLLGNLRLFCVCLTSFPKVCVFSYLDHFTVVILRSHFIFFFLSILFFYFFCIWLSLLSCVLCTQYGMLWWFSGKLNEFPSISYFFLLLLLMHTVANEFHLFVVWWDSLPIFKP